MIINCRKKPVVVRALQGTGDNLEECRDFCHNNLVVSYPVGYKVPTLILYTLEGDMRVSLNDYILQGVDREFYPCRESIFLKTYEVVD